MTGEDTQQRGDESQDRARSRTHSVAAMIFVILASLGVVVSLVGWWVRSTLFETESFMEVVETSLSSEEVVTVVGDAISEKVIAALDVESRLEAGLEAADEFLYESIAGVLDLPDAARSYLSGVDLFRLADLAEPIAAPINETIADRVDDLVRSDAFQETLPSAVAFAHQGAVALIMDDTENTLENVAVVDGEVRWDILPLIGRATNHVLDGGSLPAFLELGPVPQATYGEPRSGAVAALGAALGRSLPEDFGEVTIMNADTLEGWQSLARNLNRAVYVTILGTLALAIAALLVSPDRRRTVVQLAFGSVIAVLVAWIVQRNVIAAVDAAITGQDQQAAVDVLFAAVFESLRNVSRFYIVVAGVVGVTAHVAGKPRWLRAIRDEAKGGEEESQTSGLEQVVGSHRDAFIVGGLLLALGVWWWAGLSLGSVVLVGAALVLYLLYVLRLGEQSGAEAAPR